MKKSFLKTTDFSRNEVFEILELAAEFKANRQDPATHPLTGQSWALLFHKSSTRTRVSFEAGIHELGGYPMILDPGSMQVGRGESLQDTAKVLSRYLHGIIIRTYHQEFLENFAHEGDIPVINALTDLLHPCQVYSDLLTLSERWGERGGLGQSLSGRTLAFVGDCGCNMAHSWILGGALTGMNIHLAGPAEYAPDPKIDTLLESAGLEKNYIYTQDAREAIEGADCVYTDVWVSMGDEDERDKRLNDFRPYQVNKNLMNIADPNAFFLHCLPAHEGEEVSREVYQSPQSIVYDQAENRLHAQKAIMAKLVEAEKTTD